MIISSLTFPRGGLSDRSRKLPKAWRVNMEVLSLFGDGDMGIDGFFRKSGKAIIALTVREILDEGIARKLA